MTLPAPPRGRDTAVDALRALALLPVVAINWVGYASLPDGGPLGAAQPSGSWLAEAVNWLLAVLVMGKGVSLLAFLFGYSQSLSRRGREGSQALRHRRRRMGRLLLLGLLHGLLLYMGDILTTYALCGLLMLRWSGLRLAQLRRRLVLLLGLDLLLSGVLAVALWNSPAMTPAVSLSTPMDWSGWLGSNAYNFLFTQFWSVLLGLPLPLSLMTAGLMAGRLRLFSHCRWRAGMRRWSRRCLLPALALNLAGGSAYWWALSGRGDSNSSYLAFYLYPAVLLLSAVVPMLLLGWQAGSAWLGRLAPAGRHTLSLYLCSSVLSLLLFSGAGLAWQPGTVLLALLALLYWGGWLWLAPRLGGRRLPPEAWLAR